MASLPPISLTPSLSYSHAVTLPDLLAFSDYKVLYLCDCNEDTYINVTTMENVVNIPMRLDNLTSELYTSLIDYFKSVENQNVLVLCKTSKRSSVVALLYYAYSNKLNAAQAFEYAVSKKLPFLAVNGLKDYAAKTLKLNNNVNKLIFRQMFDYDTYTYTYLLADSVTKDAILIDTVLERYERDSRLITELGLNLLYVVDTHLHADHITASGPLQDKYKSLIGISEETNVPCDIKLHHGSSIKFGTRSLHVRSTSGHTSGCLSFILDDVSLVLTGDALFIRGCGRTDFQGGSSKKLYESVHTQIFTLPSETLIYPGHDYSGHMHSTVQEEINFNDDLGRGITQVQFSDAMDNLKLNPPKKIDIAVPGNMINGRLPPAAN